MESHYPPKIICGLGNPGDQYALTRHNVGFWFVDLLDRHHIGSFRHESQFHADVANIRMGHDKIRLLKPHTYMNDSGRSVRAIMDYFSVAPSEILVAHDDIDLPVGNIKLKMGGGHGGHNGLRDVISHIGAEFPRLRIGVAHPGHKDDVTDYVLKKPSKADAEKIVAAIEFGERAVEHWYGHGWDYAVKELHSMSTVGEGTTK